MKFKQQGIFESIFMKFQGIHLESMAHVEDNIHNEG